MEEKINIEDKDNENQINIDLLQNNLKENPVNKDENILIKDQINENDVNNFSELLNKINNKIEEKTEIKKNKDGKRASKKSNNIESNKSQKNDNINEIIPLLNDFIDLLTKKSINEEKSKELDLNRLSRLLKMLQSLFYINIEILKKIEIICNLLVNNLRDYEQIIIFLEILVGTLDYCDNKFNTDLLINSLNSLNNILEKYSNLIEPVYDITIPKIYSILNVSINSDEIIQILCYKILILFIYNNVFSYDLVSKGLLSKIKEVLNKIKNNEIHNNLNIKSEKLEDKNINNNDFNINDLINQIYILLISLTNVDSNLIKISEELMEILLDEFLNNNSIEEKYINIKLDFFELLIEKEPKSIDIFIKYKGMDCILKIFKIYEKRKDKLLKIFHILNMILTYNKAYNEIMIKLKFHEIIKDSVNKLGTDEREIDFNGKSILFLIDFKKLEEVEDYDFNQIKSKKTSLPSYVSNFLNNGKIVKVVNNLGETKKKYLFFTTDFLKVIAKKVNSNLAPKQKYVIDTDCINSIIKGYGTEAFKKSKRFYRALPDVNKCFSIIGFHPTEGQKSINVICEKESDADKWLNYMKIVISYLQENKRIKKNIKFE